MKSSQNGNVKPSALYERRMQRREKQRLDAEAKAAAEYKDFIHRGDDDDFAPCRERDDSDLEFDPPVVNMIRYDEKAAPKAVQAEVGVYEFIVEDFAPCRGRDDSDLELPSQRGNVAVSMISDDDVKAAPAPKRSAVDILKMLVGNKPHNPVNISATQQTEFKRRSPANSSLYAGAAAPSVPSDQHTVSQLVVSNGKMSPAG